MEGGANRTCIVVLGMHRSGTSALARTLAFLGADLPQQSIGPAPGNPLGHWEPATLVTVHNELLQETGRAWYGWRMFDPDAISEDGLAAYKARLGDALDADFPDSAFFVFKDPRMARFVALYRDVFARAGIIPKYVVALRNPASVIGSVVTRDGFPAALPALSWIRHILDGERDTRGGSRVFVSYEDLMNDWAGVVSHIADALDITWPRSIQEAAPAIEQFLDSELQHERVEAHIGMDPTISSWLDRGYRALLALRDDASDQQAMDALDAVRKEFDPVAAAFGDAAMPELVDRQATIDRLTEERDEARRIAQDLDRTLASLLGSRSWRMTRPLRNVGELVRSAVAPRADGE